MIKAKNIKNQKEQIEVSPLELLNKTILDFIPDPLVIIEPNGRIVQVSQRAVEIFDLTNAQSAIGKTILDYIHIYEHQKVIDNLTKLLSGWNGPSRKYRLLRSNGEAFYGEVNTSLVSNTNGVTSYLVLVIRDVTRPCEIQEYFQKNDLLNLLSHELRQPVNVIIGFSEIIGRNIDKKNNYEKLKKHNQIVTQQGVFLLNIIDQILGLARVNDLLVNNVIIDVNQILGELLEVFKLRMAQLSKQNVDLHVMYLPDNINTKAYTDLTKFKQVFTNLLFNAIKYTSRGTIQFGYHSLKNNFLTFFVSDTGIGIPIEKYNYVFNKYTQLNPNDSFNECVGLGLSLSRKLVAMLGGEIWFESKADKGTTFFFSISVNQ